MRGQAKMFLQYFEGSDKVFIIPVYQRNYDWKIENCSQLYDDLVDTIKENKPTHFFGSIVYNAQHLNEAVIIDGQQRITTISLILIAVLNAIKKGLCEPKDPNLYDKILKRYIINEYQQGENRVRLKPFRNDREAFKKLIYNNESEYLDSQITRNYRFFYDKLTVSKDLTVDELFDAISRLQIIDIELETDHGDDPQLIFESLNSTGLDLTESDKIRNFVLMNLDAKTQEKYYDKYWNKIEVDCEVNLDGFMRDYLTVKTRLIPKLKGVYSAFKTFCHSESKDIEQILEDMLLYAQAYHQLTSYDFDDAQVREIAIRLGKLDITVAYPFLMAFLIYADEENLDTVEIARVFSCVETYIFRRLMCGLPTNALNKIFASLHRSVLRYKDKYPEAKYSDIMVYLLESKNGQNSMPNDSDFVTGFSTKNIYSMNGRNKDYIFERLENGDSKEKNDIYKFLREGTYSVEHIMPQTLSQSWKESLGENWEEIHDKWLNTIANLTLTGYNSTYSNRSFQEKKSMENGFAKSRLNMNHYISEHFDNWTENELKERQNYLIEQALSLWPYPKTGFSAPMNEGDIKTLAEDNHVFTGRIILSFEFRGEREDVDSWTSMIIRVIHKLYEIDPDLLLDEANSNDNVWFTSNGTEGSVEIVNHLYFNTQSSTSNKMSILKRLFSIYNIPEEDLIFELKPLNSANE